MLGVTREQKKILWCMYVEVGMGLGWGGLVRAISVFMVLKIELHVPDFFGRKHAEQLYLRNDTTYKHRACIVTLQSVLGSLHQNKPEFTAQLSRG